MQLDALLTPAAIFAADRRADVSVRMNDPIVEMLDSETVAIIDYLTKAGAAIIQPYPNVCLAFSISRIIADSDCVIRQVVRLPETHVAPMLELHLKNVMTRAANWIQAFDPLAFITADVTPKPTAVMAPNWHRNKRKTWWRSND